MGSLVAKYIGRYVSEHLKSGKGGVEYALLTPSHTVKSSKAVNDRISLLHVHHITSNIQGYHARLMHTLINGARMDPEGFVGNFIPPAVLNSLGGAAQQFGCTPGID